MKARMNILVAWISASLIYGILALFSISYENGQHTSLVLLSASLGATLGWLLGILATPFDRGERAKLSEMAKVAYGFITGYLISKVDAFISALYSHGELQQNGHFGIYVIVALTALLNTLIVTYVNRNYWLSTMKDNP